MRVTTISGEIAPFGGLQRLQEDIGSLCDHNGIPLRIAITEMNGRKWHCEVEALHSQNGKKLPKMASVFAFRQRRLARTNAFNGVMLVPTGINCEIGGHAGDATPAARLLASVCDRLVIHPNVVNASEVNEQPANCLYVEGSLICRLLMGSISLREVRSNRILVITEEREDGPWVIDQVVNTTSAARATLGVNSPKVMVMRHPLSMTMETSPSGRSVGNIAGFEELFSLLQAEKKNYDAVAICSKITPSLQLDELFQAYFRGDGPNPWGGVEAALTHAVSAAWDVPAAHAPTLEELDLRTASLGQVDPRKSAEAVATSFMFCLMKGLHRAPAVVTSPDGIYDPSLVAAEDISCLIIPDGCVGMPTLAALIQGIPVIAVRNNTNMMKNDLTRLPFAPGQLWVVENYLEAAGLIAAMKAGVHPCSITRPLARTQVVGGH